MAGKTFGAEAIRNLAFLGHGGAGKTTLVDSIAFAAGATKRKGSVADGTALTDFLPEEKSRGITIGTAIAHAIWSGTKLNLIDTPGYLDFAGDAKAGVRVADGGILVVDASSGVLVGTENAWEYCQERGIPRMFFISMMDKENARFDSLVAEIRTNFSKDAVPLEIPIGSGDGFKGTIDLLSGRARFFDRSSLKGDYKEQEIPDDLKANFDQAYQELIEAIAATDDSLLEEYLEQGTIEPKRAAGALKTAMASGTLFPILCGSAEGGYGTKSLIERLVDLMPSPNHSKPERARRSGSDEEVELSASADGPLALLVFKMTAEPRVGELSYFRVFSGKISNGDSVKNVNRESTEKLGHLAIPQGKDRVEVSELEAGDIGVVAKLKDTHTGDTLCGEDQSLILEEIKFPDSDVATAVKAAQRGDEDKVSTGLHKLHAEDPTFNAKFDPELGQTIARGLGEIHLEVAMERLRDRYGVEVVTEPPRIPYRETIKKTAEGQGRYRKQTGGRGQFGDCWIRLSPAPRGSGYEFVNKIAGGVIPSKFIPSVDKGVQEAAARGVVAGFPVLDFSAEVYDGSHHSVDSSDIAFKVAGSLAFKEVAQHAEPILLEPIYEVEVTVPEAYMGDVIGDLNQRRGRILGMEPRGKKQVVKAHVPLAELHKYSSTLRSITHGRGGYKRKLHTYEEVPPQIVDKIIEEAEKARMEAKK
ncbi:MAG: elongation factor G [Candidatus Palauibacterales bacterium]|nr:elongation factor G [Candidatus Palauibacterales bacterium]